MTIGVAITTSELPTRRGLQANILTQIAGAVQEDLAESTDVPSRQGGSTKLQGKLLHTSARRKGTHFPGGNAGLAEGKCQRQTLVAGPPEKKP